MAGTYILHSVNEQMVPVGAYIDGFIVLRVDGRFERRGRYADVNSGTVQEFSYSGKYQVRNGAVFDVTNMPQGKYPLPSGSFVGTDLSWCQTLPADGCDMLLYQRELPEL